MTRLLAIMAAVVAFVLAGAGSANAAAPPAWPLILSDSSGPEVMSAQYLLRDRGAQIDADGIMGPMTTAAVKAFQKAQGLDADGLVGPLTWAKLVVTVDSGASGDAVRGVQHQLVRNGYTLTPDGAFGASTVTAVTDFKTKHGLAATSQVDATTWQWLIGASAGGWSLPLPRTALPRSEYDDPHHDYPAIDLPVGTGTRALAVTSGTVSRVDDSTCGRGIVITANGVRYIYCHLSQWVAAAGATVQPGQLVGYTGATGHVTGPHLHFGIKIGTTSHCPQRFLLAIYDGDNPPAAASLPTSGCSN